jgi:4-hydroxy-2-oxoheptanedioate aldolase
MKEISVASLRSGQPMLGLAVSYPAPGVVERLGGDWDWIWIDGQHGELGYQDTLALVRACDLIRRPAIVRVASHEPGRIGLTLDMGAGGVIVPLVNTPAEARALAQAAKFPPVGERSFGGRRPIDRRGRTYSDTANQDTLLIAQIETPEAIKNAEAIAAVPGIDALFFGPDDVALRLGLRMDQPRPKEDLERDLARMAAACRQHGKLAVCIGASPDTMTLGLRHGYNLIVGGADAAFLAAGSKQAAERARAALASPPAKPATAAPAAQTPGGVY